MMRQSQEWDEIVVNAICRLRGEYFGSEYTGDPERGIPAAGCHRVIALTNNYAATSGVDAAELDFLGWKEGATPPALRALFDDFCDSSTFGMRYVVSCLVPRRFVDFRRSKPEPEFYLLACKRNDVLPSETIFLDDLGL
jgi:hypothetical protein